MKWLARRREQKRIRPLFDDGQYVQTSGYGRTADWGHLRGVVVTISDGLVSVVWDGSSFIDQMDPREVLPL